MNKEEEKLNDGVFLTAGWLEDFLSEIDKQESTISMNGNWPQERAIGMRIALDIIKNHI